MGGNLHTFYWSAFLYKVRERESASDDQEVVSVTGKKEYDPRSQDHI